VELNCKIHLPLDVDSWLLLLGGVPQVLVLRLGRAEGRVAVRGCGQGGGRHGLRVRREHCWLHVRWQRVGSVRRQHWTGVRVVRGGWQRSESTIVHPTLNKFLLAATIIAYIK